MRSVLSALARRITGNDDELVYKRYRHAPFEHLEFEILESWHPVENGLELVFTNEACDLPQLFFQTVGKTDEFDSAGSFVDFLRKQNPDQDYGRAAAVLAGGHRGVELEYDETGGDLRVFALIVDVGEGILWFYVKAPQDRADHYRPIRERLRNTLRFG